MSRKIRVVHIINSFQFGGAEAMLCNLLLRADITRFESSVVALVDDLTVAGPVLDAGIPLVTMGMKPGIPDPRGVIRLGRHLRKLRPDVIQTWMDHSNLIGGLAARAVAKTPLVWGIHHSHHVPELTKRSTLMTVAACARLSRRLPARIVFCSEHALKLYTADGFCRDNSVVIPNGFNTERFSPDPAARQEIRRELGLPPDTLLIGLVARFDPFKDHLTFVRAAAMLRARRPEVHFLMCGHNVDWNNASLAGHLRDAGLADRCHLLGPRRDVPRVHASLDILASSSISEAFPLTVGEAMSCGVPCVATDVGDSALIIGRAGRIVPPSDPAAMADAWEQVLSLGPGERERLGAAARKRVRELFDLGSVTRRYEELYQQLVVPAAAPEPAVNGAVVRAGT